MLGSVASSMKSLRCLVLNAGGTSTQDKEAAEHWAAEAATAQDRPELAFLQQVPQ